MGPGWCVWSDPAFSTGFVGAPRDGGRPCVGLFSRPRGCKPGKKCAKSGFGHTPYMNATELLNFISTVRSDLARCDAADRKCNQIGYAQRFNRPANWRPFRAAVMSDDLFAAPAGW